MNVNRYLNIVTQMVLLIVLILELVLVIKMKILVMIKLVKVDQELVSGMLMNVETKNVLKQMHSFLQMNNAVIL